MNEITKIFIKRQLKNFSKILLGLIIAAAAFIAIMIMVDLKILGHVALAAFVVMVIYKIILLMIVYFKDEMKISKDMAGRKDGGRS